MRAKRWQVCLLTVLISACGGRQPTSFDTQYRAVLDSAPTSKMEWAERGWWHLLADDFSLAKRAFAQPR